MKKRLLMISTFLLSFIILITNVNAAQELTCVYPDGTTQYAVKLVQDKDGNLYTYKNSKTLDSDSSLWKEFTMPKDKINLTYILTDPNYTSKAASEYYDLENNVLTACPTCLNYETILHKKDLRIEAYSYKDSDKTCEPGFVKIHQDSDEIKSDEQINNEKDMDYKGKMKEYQMNYCRYALMSDRSYVGLEKGSVTLEFYYNKNNFHFPDGYTTKFDVNDIFSSNSGNCPQKLYSSYYTNGEDFYVNDPGVTNRNREWALTLSKYYSSSPSDNQVPTTDDACQLLGDDTIKLIDDIMRIIRIIVPLLLIVLGMTDFLRATFSDNEDNMKKDRERFIKRIIAAIIVFIVPIFVHLVLNVANSVWSDINPETCIK